MALLTRELDEAEKRRASAAAQGVSASQPQPPSPSTTPAAAAGGAARRRHQRAPYITPVRVHRADGSFVDGRTEDISEGGILVILPQTKEIAEKASAGSSGNQPELVRARFALPTDGQIVNLVGKVRWIRDARGRAALGIEFDSLPIPVRKAINTYVDFVGAEQSPASIR
jgi:hypothetical protein